ncbi:MAG: hypothetical protein QOF58_6571 [Pseudonocardiales bacterium]|jgi:dTDP-4-amino-4,6-dideoxygalactose transaminase|nr:hypothetical protein [Pseudonocardiales bacterium]
MTMTVAVPPAVRPNAKPFLHGEEFDAVTAAMRAGQYGHGEITEQFEDAVARFLGVDEVVAVSSGTMALHIALLDAGIGPGHEVIVPSQTFAATIQPILACGASPRFVDIDPATLTIGAADILEAITPATRAVLPVLYGGRAVDLTAIQDELDRRGITVIEDAAHAFGSRHGSVLVGARPGVATCFSFGPIKNLTCLEGGLLVPRGSAANARRLRLLGITQSQAQRVTATSYAIDGFGLRGTLSNVHAAVGLVQLDRFPEIAATRKALWSAYADALRAIGVTVVDLDVERSVPFNCVVRIECERRDQVHRLLQQRGIGVGVHYPPNHRQPAFARWHRVLPATEQTAEEILSLPFHPAMSVTDVGYVVDALAQALADTATTTEGIR